MTNQNQPKPTHTILRRAFIRLLAVLDVVSDLPTTAGRREIIETTFFTLLDHRTDRMIRIAHILTLVNLALASSGIVVTDNELVEMIEGLDVMIYTNIDGVNFVVGFGLLGLDQERFDDGWRSVEQFLLAMRGLDGGMS